VVVLMVTVCPELTAPAPGLKVGVTTVPLVELEPPQALMATIASAKTTGVETNVPLRVLMVHLLTPNGGGDDKGQAHNIDASLAIIE
jgi:hypothetical protein